MARQRYWASVRGQGETVRWLKDHANHRESDCLIWPFSRLKNGYGNFGTNGRQHYAHRFMCELVNGPAPPNHECAHLCGNGHLGCVNPNHLSWKTKSANGRDSWRHTPKVRNHWGSRGRLNADQVNAIRQLRGKETQSKIASMFKISEPSVRDIFLGRTYNDC